MTPTDILRELVEAMEAAPASIAYPCTMAGTPCHPEGSHIACRFCGRREFAMYDALAELPTDGAHLMRHNPDCPLLVAQRWLVVNR